MNIYDFKVLNNKGELVDFNKYKGKVLLIVNTATGCGFTPQYKGLQEMYDILLYRIHQFFHHYQVLEIKSYYKGNLKFQSPSPYIYHTFPAIPYIEE